MNQVMLSIAVIVMVLFVSCKSESKKGNRKSNTETLEKGGTSDISFGVRGNCGMCKTTIEKSLSEVTGVSSTNWNKESKTIAVSFEKSNIDEMGVHNAIAASGYDTEKVTGDIRAYNNLPGCCQYDREMIINESSKIKEENHLKHIH
jgi:copper chaperone CopZ